MHRVLAVSVLALLLGFAATAGASHAAGLSQFSLRLGAIGTHYDRRLVYAHSGSTLYADLGSGVGPYLAGEYRPVPLFGLELSTARLPLDARVRTTQIVPVSFVPLILEERLVRSDSGRFTLAPVTLALLFHPWHGSRTDVYLGPELAWVRYHTRVEDLGRRPAEIGYGAKAGVELRLGASAWAIAAELGHLEIHHTPTEHDLYGNLGITTGSLLLVLHGR